MKLKALRVFTGSAFKPLEITIDDGRITQLEPWDDSHYCGEAFFAMPGAVDIHTHGCMGFDWTTAAEKDFSTMCDGYLKHGTTTVLATIMTAPKEQMLNAARRIGNFSSPVVAGVYMEGPFFMPEKRGAHDSAYLTDTDIDFALNINTLSGGKLLMVAADPLCAGFDAFASAMKENGIKVALAHTNAQYDRCMDAIAGGAGHITHLFNAMSPLHHRAPALIGAAFDACTSAELICDMEHIHPSVIRTAFKCLAERAVIVSDSMSACGMDAGEYILGGQQVFVKNQCATLNDGTLAGSAVFCGDGMRRAIKAGIGIEDAIFAATQAPAKAVGIDHICGKLSVGMPADIVLCTKNLVPISIFKQGQEISL